MGRVIRHATGTATVIPGDVLDARATAADLLERARAEAQALQTEAVARGLEAGRAEAAAGLIDAAVARATFIADARDRVLELTAQLAQRIVGETLAADPGRIAQLAAEPLRRLGSATTVCITVCGDDAPALRAALERATADAPAAVEVRVDDTMARGGVRVASELGELDARIETRLQTLLATLDGALP